MVLIIFKSENCSYTGDLPYYLLPKHSNSDQKTKVTTNFDL